MSVIMLDGVDFSYLSSLVPVFKNLSFSADSSWKTGLVGANGSGKTTLFKLLCGELPCSGRINTNLKFVRFPFEVSEGETVYALAGRLGGEEWEFLRELALLGLPEDICGRPFYQLSGGERTKVMLAALFCMEAFPLIDEPTDSLDLAGRRRLAEYLKGKGGYIVASHDRAFLNDCTDHTVFLSGGGAQVVGGNYSVWREAQDRYLANAAGSKRKLEHEAGRMSAAARRAEGWAFMAEREKFGGGGDRGFLGAKAARIMKRSKAAAARKEKAAENARELARALPDEGVKLQLRPMDCRKPCLFSLENFCLTVGGKGLFFGFDMRIMRGERIAVTGPNGCGKSTLLKYIADNAQGTAVSYLAQQFEDGGSPAQYAARFDISEGDFYSMLAKLGFKESDRGRDMRNLSVGQRKKVALARSLLQSAQLYIWDEPLNYLDVTAREMVEEAVINSGATIIFVEHDAQFIKNAATRVIEL